MLATLILFLNVLTSDMFLAAASEEMKLRYQQPGKTWFEALPIGNGRLGAMVYGGVGKELLQLNEDTLWSGEPRDLQNHTARKHLPEIRRLLLEDKTAEAEKLIDSTMLGPWNECYMPLGNLALDFKHEGEIVDYRRELDIARAVVKISYKVGEIGYAREIIASHPDRAIVIHLSADKQGSLNFNVSLTSQLRYEVQADGNRLVMTGRAPKQAFPHYLGKKEAIYDDAENGAGMRFQAAIQAQAGDGKVTPIKNALSVENADSVTLILTVATSYNGFDKSPSSQGKDYVGLCQKDMERASAKTWRRLLNSHIEDYQRLFNRVDLNLGSDSAADLPTDQRVKTYQPGGDPALTVLYFQFGRYLLISSSRPGTQPANLQGIWSRLMQPAWSANWTLNCNAEINYWAAETANLSECHLPLIRLTEELAVDGAKTAKNLYGARGWVAHHNADIWRTTSPVGGTGLWAIYQVGSGWLCHHLWEHYAFTGDKEYLKRVWPVMRDAALFYIDTLQEDKRRRLVTSPSESFENRYKKPDGTIGWACMGSAQDIQIIRDLFNNCIAASEILNVEISVREKIFQTLSRLAPHQISPRTGRLQEWNDDWPAANPKGGQVAHGWALAPGNQITLRSTPKLAAAFRKTLEYRKPRESFNCGSWPGSFAANYWARLEDGEQIQAVFDRHFKLAVSPNLTSNLFVHWEIDGNLGITAAVAEALLQSHAGEINLLPALPDKYPNGFVKGLCARGGFEVDMEWKDGKLTRTVIRSKLGNPCKIRYGEKVIELETEAGKSYMPAFSR